MSKREYKVISLFSGCGGMDVGIEGGFEFLGESYKRTGFNVVWANDIDDDACASFNNYFGANKCVCGDIADPLVCKSMPKKCDMVVGGFPCQDFSITRATQRKGVKVKRGKLYKYFVKTVEEKKPKVFIAENVKGILSANEGQAIKLITKEFAHIDGGYNIYCDLYKFVEYGVPQTRERVLIVGVRSDLNYVFKKPDILCRNEKEYVTSGDALAGVAEGMPNHRYINSMERTKKILEAIPEGENINYLPKDHPLYVKGLMSNIYRRLNRKKPSPTIIAGGGGGTWGYHYKQPRALTNRERARIQSFPDNFEFKGSITEVRRQIGNAVPPVGVYPVAVELAKAMKAEAKNLEKVVAINICGEIEMEELKR
jgi:DNA (cytosine-5)-methyltransferase 1